ncbi:predicted protein [Paecilomyces variotii No. 5]|uniref:Uncharacterized protein n=1 Tax=Byssochlamys spectabilis (strain No. 5 / NBRC 109023) TaxID=1356009 RepID=V5I061_BYSSN|nr:predicted protein [Paecilomyces variotii No. 5]
MKETRYIVVLSLSDDAIRRFTNEPHILDVPYRLELDGSTGIIRVMPSNNHGSPMSLLTIQIAFKYGMMGKTTTQCRFGNATRYSGTVSTKSKEPDQCFIPPSRMGTPGQPRPWPTVVFENSEGDVRIVVIMTVRSQSRSILVEKLQLAPPNSPPLTRAGIIDGFRQSIPPALPPLVRQPAPTQQAYSIQGITVMTAGATDQLVLPFLAVYDRPPVHPEGDIVVSMQELVDLTSDIWV